MGVWARQSAPIPHMEAVPLPHFRLHPQLCYIILQFDFELHLHLLTELLRVVYCDVDPPPTIENNLGLNRPESGESSIHVFFSPLQRVARVYICPEQLPAQESITPDLM